jgi:hypothetical protein
MSLETLDQVTHECPATGGYMRQTLTNPDWRAVDRGYRLFAGDMSFIAQGGDITDVAFAVASEEITGVLVAVVALDNPATIAAGTALTIGLATTGLIELVS